MKAQEKLKILFLSQRFLFPLNSGGKIRTGKILEELSKKFQITVISNYDEKKDKAYLPQMRGICDKFISVPWEEAQRYSAKFYWNILVKSFSIYPITLLNDYSKNLENAILQELKEENYDLAICDFMQSTLNFRRVSGIPQILFQHNVEATIFKRHMQQTVNPISKLFWGLQYLKMFYHEKKQSQKFDAVIAVSPIDKERMVEWYGLNNVYTIPTGVDTEFYSPSPVPQKKQIVFVGAMDWLPNHDAVDFFLEEIFPIVLNNEPDARFVIVGRNPSPKLKKLIDRSANVSLTGWVEDIRPYVHESAVFVVPIRIGGGTRLKIYEGMAMGKAVVSTSIGAEGLPLTDKEHLYFADSAADFAQAILLLLRDERERKLLGERARQFVYENFRWEIVGQEFANICTEVVGKFRP